MKNREDQLFRISVLIKGFDGIVEIVGGIVLLIFPVESIRKPFLNLASHELVREPNGVLGGILNNLAQSFSASGDLFGAIFLLTHGVIKVFLVYSLLKKKLWSYPVAIAVFTIFGIIQTVQFAQSRSVWLLILTVFDVVVVLLTYFEYKRLKANLRH